MPHCLRAGFSREQGTVSADLVVSQNFPELARFDAEHEHVEVVIAVKDVVAESF